MKPPPTSSTPPPEPPDRPARRPGGHQSYKLGGSTQITPAGPSKYDDGVAHKHYEPGEHDPLHNEDVAHEHIDVNISGLIASAVVLIVVTLAAQVGMYFLFGVFENQAQARDLEAQVSPLARPATDMPRTTMESPFFSQGVGGPQLLTNEPVALEKQRNEERKRLEGYGWVDEKAGVAHLPIEEAKKLLVKRGVAVREGEPIAPALGTRLPARGESSGGRIITNAPAEPAPGTAAPPAAPDHGGHGEQPKPPAKPGGH